MSNLTKKDLSKKISSELEITMIESDKLIHSLINIIKHGLHVSRKVKISSFGAFKVTKTPNRIGRNPKTKESFIISSRNRIKLILSTKVKRYLN